jgi:hypothetical protein
MRLYKFKDLTDNATHDHFLQIVLDKCIWCASPASLNDADEFRFRLDYQPTPRTLPLLINAIATFGANLLPPQLPASHAITNERLEFLAAPVIAAMIENCRTSIGVTSFSMDKEDSHLWDLYGGHHNGACIEIEIPDDHIGHRYHPVEYLSDRVFHVDLFLEGYGTCEAA